MITTEDPQLRPAAIEVEAVLRQRARRLTDLIGRRGGPVELVERLEQLLTGDRLAFAVSAIQASLAKVSPSDPPRSVTRQLPDWFIAVTVWPGHAPEDLRSRQGGYLGLLAELTAPAYETKEGRHIAHWICGHEGGRMTVRLAVFPSPRSGAPILIPLALLAEDDRELLHLPPEAKATA
ncbi:MAG: hypothetical protein ACRDIZ_02420 [Actinomycetota bacterium]